MADHLDALNEFAKSVAERLFEAYPSWRAYARGEREPDSDDVYLVVEVPPPPEADLEQGLVIWTEGSLVVLSLDLYHAHFKWPIGPRDEDVLFTIEGILNEDLAIASWWDGPDWLGARTVPRGERISRMRIYPAADRVRLRSWRGTLDQDLAL